jgi:hypothetical protein
MAEFSRDDLEVKAALRRKIDDQLIGVLEDYQKGMMDFSDIKLEMQKLDSKIETLIQTLTPLVQKHEKAMYGDQEKMGEGGMISEITNIKSDIRNTKWIFSTLGVVIVAAISAFFQRLFGGGK